MSTCYCILLCILLLEFLSFQAYAQPGMINIDCGTLKEYNETRKKYNNVNVTWIGDVEYVKGGQIHDVGVPYRDHGNRSRNLRSFPNLKKNCYEVPVEKDNKYLVRPTYLYGNYDNKGVAPSFDLIIDANVIVSVNTTMADFIVSQEIVWTAKGDKLSVCLGRSHDNHDPFISSLQLRKLDPGMYEKIGNDSIIILASRTNFDPNKTEIRYPLEPYDRQWNSTNEYDGVKFETIYTSLNVSNVLAQEKPPNDVMKSAIVASISAKSMDIPLLYAQPGHSYALFLYFAEVQDHNHTNLTRSFNVLIDGSTHTTVTPLYLNATEVYYNGVIKEISLVPETTSTLGPLLNAMEIFYTGDRVKAGTHPDDVEAMEDARRSLEIEFWSGDPCLPPAYPWEGVQCDGNPPRVTSIDLSNRNLDGVIPSSFSKLPQLKKLDLSNNNFTAIPQDLKRLKIQINYCGNSLLKGECNIQGSSPSNQEGENKGEKSPKNSKTMYIAIGAATAATVVILVIVLLVFFLRKKAKRATSSEVEGPAYYVVRDATEKVGK